MVWPAIAAAVIGAGASLISGSKSRKAAEKEGERVDQLEREKFLEAKKQADILIEKGDDAAAQALIESEKADLGAERYEAFSNEYAKSVEDFAAARQTAGLDYAQRAQDFAQRNEDAAIDLYEKIGIQAEEREAMGAAGAGRITDTAATGADSLRGATAEGISSLRGAAGDVMTQAERGGDLQTEAFENIEGRYSPFLTSERQAVGQLGAELGLSPGEQYTGYRDSPAYQSAVDATRTAEEESLGSIKQDAANTGTLYSGRRIADVGERVRRGSYERAGIESSYYQNYMQMLQQQANPQATGAVSGYEAGTAQNISQNYMTAAQSAQAAESQALSARMGAESTALSATLGAQTNAEALRQNTMRTGDEGAYLRDMLQKGTEGMGPELGTMQTGLEPYPIAASGFDPGTAGSGYRMDAATIPLNTQANAGGMITGNMPGGLPGAGLRMEGYGAQSASVADAVSGATNLYTSYMAGPQQYGPQPQNNPPPGTNLYQYGQY